MKARVASMDQEAQDGIREKLRRADKHLERLTSELGAFFDTEPHAYRTDADYEAGSYSVRVEIKAKPPIPISITCGDYIHCLRCALEHLVGGAVPNPSLKTSFPLEAKKKHFFNKVIMPAWSGKTDGPLTGLAPEGELFALIQASQPYRGKHGSAHHPLWLLRELSNAAKTGPIFAAAGAHRKITEPSLALDGTDIKYIGNSAFRYDKPLVDGDDVL